MERFTTFSSEETKSLGALLAEESVRTPSSSARVFALKGNLGAGKTTFIQGFFRGLGVRRAPASPTFILMRRTGIKKKYFKNVYHLDAYRLKSGRDLKVLEFEKILKDPKALVLVEWADRVKDILPKSTLWLSFAHKKENERTINFK